MSQLDQIRTKINDIDEKMAALFEERMHMSEQVAAFKRERGLSVRDAERERELIARSAACIGDRGRRLLLCAVPAQGHRPLLCLPDPPDGGDARSPTAAWRARTPTSPRAACSRRRISSPTRLLRGVPRPWSAARSTASSSPLENSYAGEVGTVMDLLFSGELFINQVLDLDISHSLLGMDGATPDTVRTVVSHPQALRQCDEYIQRHGYQIESYANTAMARQRVREANDLTLGAIASDEAAEVFGLRVLDRDISTARNNTTRFAALSRTRNQTETVRKREDENFVLVFTVQNDAGSLAQTLNIIGAHGYNMRTLRSRPMKDLSWKYFFYVEAEGSINTHKRPRDAAGAVRHLRQAPASSAPTTPTTSEKGEAPWSFPSPCRRKATIFT